MSIGPRAGLLLAFMTATTALAQGPSLEDLRRAAEAAFDRGRWTTPPEDNANELVARILARRPGDLVALSLKDRMVKIYLALAEKSMSAGAADKASAYLGRALAVRPGDPTVRGFLDRLAQRKKKTADTAYDRLARAFNAAEQQASYAGWQKFVARFPHSEFSAYADGQLAELGRGRLLVTTESAPARVFVDGQEAGMTPLMVEDVTPGQHDVRVQLKAKTRYRRKKGHRQNYTRLLIQDIQVGG